MTKEETPKVEPLMTDSEIESQVKMLLNVEVEEPTKETKATKEVEEKLNQTQSIQISSDIGNVLAQLQVLIDGKWLPEHIKKPETAFTIQQMGKELGFPTMQAFHYIIPIDGKLSLTAKAMSALLRKNGVRFTCTRYGEYVYNVDGEIKYSKFPLYPRGSKEHNDYYVTIISEVKGKRFYKDGTFDEQSAEFTVLDAKDMFGAKWESKANWHKMPKQMTYARALSIFSNLIGADFMLGLYSADELLDHSEKGNNSILNEEGKIISIDDIQ
jgi:hypothetical protein